MKLLKGFLCWAEQDSILLHFGIGSQNAVADSLSRENQVINSKWTNV